MKNIRKLTAILLTAVMALTMLTACGGGGGSSRTEKERYVAGINDYLNHMVTGCQDNLKYDSALDIKAQNYQKTYEALRNTTPPTKESEAKDLALNAAGMGDKRYLVVACELGRSASENQKIHLAALAVKDGVDNEYLAKYRWTISYAWGAVNAQKQTVPIYIVLHCEG